MSDKKDNNSVIIKGESIYSKDQINIAKDSHTNKANFPQAVMNILCERYKCTPEDVYKNLPNDITVVIPDGPLGILKTYVIIAFGDDE